MRVVHTERFASVITTGTAVEVTSYQINPGLPSVFPWLADVANRYEKYKFASMSFRYIPQSAALAGTVTCAFDFDPNDDAPTVMAEATTYHDYVSTSIWQEARLMLDLANGDRMPEKNTRPGLPGADLDLNMYDVGVLHVLTEGAAAATIGYLEVTYVVDLFIHQVQGGVGGGSVSVAGGLDNTHLVGTDFTPAAHANLPVRVSAAGVFTFVQPFEGLVSFSLAGSVFNSLAMTNTGTATWDDISQRFPTDALSLAGYGRIRASTGQTFIPATTCTTCTAAYWMFARAPYVSLT
jgi:hypothetical protein